MRTDDLDEKSCITADLRIAHPHPIGELRVYTSCVLPTILMYLTQYISTTKPPISFPRGPNSSGYSGLWRQVFYEQEIYYKHVRCP